MSQRTILPANTASMNGNTPHLKDAGAKHEKLPRRGRRQHGRNHDGEEFLLLKAQAQFFEADAVDALEQEQLAAGAAQAIGQQAADRRAQTTASMQQTTKWLLLFQM